MGEGSDFVPGAYLVESLEHFYAPATHKLRRPQEARLTKVVCSVTTLNPTFGEASLAVRTVGEDSEKIARG
jgi:hypothetical protein